MADYSFYTGEEEGYSLSEKKDYEESLRNMALMWLTNPDMQEFKRTGVKGEGSSSIDKYFKYIVPRLMQIGYGLGPQYGRDYEGSAGFNPQFFLSMLKPHLNDDQFSRFSEMYLPRLESQYKRSRSRHERKGEDYEGVWGVGGTKRSRFSKWLSDTLAGQMDAEY